VRRPRPRVSIPAQLLLVSFVLVLLPWLGLRLAGELQRLALDAQVHALAATARSASAALGGRPDLLPSAEAGAEPGRVIRVLDLPEPIDVDGRAEDWADPAIEAHRLPESDEPASVLPLSAEYRIGRWGNAVFVLFEVRDLEVVPGNPSGGGDGDHLEVAVVTADDEFLRFGVDAGGDGPVSTWVAHEDGRHAPDSRITGEWRTAEGGWTVELRLPRTLVGPRLAFAVVDVDDPGGREIGGRLETSGTATRQELAAVPAPPAELGALLAGLGGLRTRLWAVDTGKHVLAHGGTLGPGASAPVPAPLPARLLRGLSRLVRAAVGTPRVELAPGPPGTHEVDRALAGEPSTRRRAAAESGAVVLSAAHPVRVGGVVVAAVLAQETATDVLAVRGGAIDRILGGILGVSLLGAVALLVFAARLSFRILRLRDAVEDLAEEARAAPVALPGTEKGDEIGDLARSVAALASRQGEHAAYLEQLGRRLSHEMRTPVGVVRSSLDNLRLVGLPDPARVYLDRADEGVRRLVLILSRMSEAVRLEQALASTEREEYDLVPVVRGCVEGYRAASPGRDLAFREPGEPLRVSGSPDLLAQLLDKLVENALGFARPATAVEVELHRYGRTAALSVRNDGPPPPRRWQAVSSIRWCPCGRRAPRRTRREVRTSASASTSSGSWPSSTAARRPPTTGPTGGESSSPSRFPSPRGRESAQAPEDVAARDCGWTFPVARSLPARIEVDLRPNS